MIEKYNLLTVIEMVEDGTRKDGYKFAKAKFQCDCGNTVITDFRQVKSGGIKSCGCLKKTLTSARFTTHGLTKTKLGSKVLAAWRDAKRRCYDLEHSEYRRYGLVGITMQDSWLEDVDAFNQYASTLPNFSIEMSLDRVDNDKGYCEGNLRWTTDAIQTRNQGKSSNNSSGYNGVSYHVNKTGCTYVMARWKDLVGKQCSKTFTIPKHGLLPAFLMACNYRDKMIAELNEQGAGYSESHGK